MKYLMSYEELNTTDLPEIGDYVLTFPNVFNSPGFDHVNYYLSTHVGFVRDKHYPGYDVSYKNQTDEIKELLSNNANKGLFRFQKGDIQYWSKNIEDLEQIILSRQFNI